MTATIPQFQPQCSCDSANIRPRRRPPDQTMEVSDSLWVDLHRTAAARPGIVPHARQAENLFIIAEGTCAGASKIRAPTPSIRSNRFGRELPSPSRSTPAHPSTRGSFSKPGRNVRFRSFPSRREPRRRCEIPSRTFRRANNFDAEN